MAYRTLELNLISAKDLTNVNIFTKMEVYAWAFIAGDPRSKKRTPVDKEGGRNPTWNFTVKFNVPEYDVSTLVLDIVLKSERALGDRDVGEVHVPVRELLEGWHRAAASVPAANGGDDGKKLAPPVQFLSYQVRRTGSGKAKGVLNISYKFSDVVSVPTPPPPQIAGHPVTAYTYPQGQPPPAAYPPPDMKSGTPKNGSEPVTAYPAAGTSAAYPPPQQAGYGYPPPQQAGYGYPPPQQAGYGYPPPQQAGYGYPPPQQAGYGYPTTAGYPPQGGYGYPPQQGGSGYPPQGGYVYAPPQQQQPQAGKKKSRMGLGLGAGLIGGALGGMILGDMVSDAASYDAGYDDGFDDGFDY